MGGRDHAEGGESLFETPFCATCHRYPHNVYQFASLYLQTWDFNPCYHDLLDESQVFFLDLYPTKKAKKALMEHIKETVTRNKSVLGVNSLLLIDDCVTELLNGDLNIQPLMTNGRTMGLTVITLWQSNVKSGQVGNVIRSNAALVIYFESMVNAVSATNSWVDEAKPFLELVKNEVKGRTAGIILPGQVPKFRKMEAPPKYALKKLGGVKNLSKVHSLLLKSSPFSEDIIAG
jgi:hypothetical protein